MADPHAIANYRGMVSASARRARMDDGLLTDRRTAPLVADTGSARTPALRPGPGLREDVDHGGAAGALLPLLRVRRLVETHATVWAMCILGPSVRGPRTNRAKWTLAL